MYTPVNPSFTVKKWALRGPKLDGYVFVMTPKLFPFTADAFSDRKENRAQLFKANDVVS